VNHPAKGQFTIRDQRPLKFIDRCLTDGATQQQFLDALNGRVFFWLTQKRLTTLLNARLYRSSEHTVLHVDTSALLARHGGVAQLAPYNTGSVHVPTAPKRGADVFIDIADYPYDDWRRRRGSSSDPIVELTLPYSVPDIAEFTVRVETWRGGEPVDLLYQK
jgi:hypothetical protein